MRKALQAQVRHAGPFLGCTVFHWSPLRPPPFPRTQHAAYGARKWRSTVPTSQFAACFDAALLVIISLLKGT